MTEPIAFPLIEAVNVAWLSDRLPARVGADVWVATDMPNPRPPLAVKVTRVGGPRRNLVTDTPMVMFECWAEDRVAAADLARYACAEVEALDITEGLFAGVRHHREVGGPAFQPDPDSDSPRYVFTVEQMARGSALT